MDSLAASLLLATIVFGAIGALIGQRKGRPLAGLWWGLLLGPIGWLLVYLGPDLNQPKAVTCPFCGGALPVNQAKCNHCGNVIRWIKGKPLRPGRFAE